MNEEKKQLTIFNEEGTIVQTGPKFFVHHLYPPTRSVLTDDELFFYTIGEAQEAVQKNLKQNPYSVYPIAIAEIKETYSTKPQNIEIIRTEMQ